MLVPIINYLFLQTTESPGIILVQEFLPRQEFILWRYLIQFYLLEPVAVQYIAQSIMEIVGLKFSQEFLQLLRRVLRKTMENYLQQFIWRGFLHLMIMELHGKNHFQL